MIELIQIPWSPYCIAQRRILEYSGERFKIINTSSADRSYIWRITKERYYQVPVLRDGKNVLFETDDNSQVIGKYLDDRLQLGLFPKAWEGVQSLIWRHIENDVEGIGFRLNDIYWKKFVPRADRMGFMRHKERKFGRGCLEKWLEQREQLLEQLEQQLHPYEQMLSGKRYLLEDRPRFVDFDLYGILGNYLYSGNYALPSAYTQLKAWYGRMKTLKLSSVAQETRHS